MKKSEIRRVVTTNNEQDKGIVMMDHYVECKQINDTYSNLQIWETAEVPVDNSDDDKTDRFTGAHNIPTGTGFRYGDFEPGFQSSMHRTKTIDYGIVIEGEMDMELDGGQTITLKTGDVIIQRGTKHRWINNSNALCRMAFVMVAAQEGVEDWQGG